MEISIFCRIRSVATIWYGRMTSSMWSAVRTQYLVKILSRVRLAKNVLAKPVRSRIGLFVASAHHDVNSKEFDVFRPLFSTCHLAQVLTTGGVGVVLGQRAVADHEDLDVLEQP